MDTEVKDHLRKMIEQEASEVDLCMWSVRKLSTDYEQQVEEGWARLARQTKGKIDRFTTRAESSTKTIKVLKAVLASIDAEKPEYCPFDCDSCHGEGCPCDRLGCDGHDREVKG